MTSDFVGVFSATLAPVAGRRNLVVDPPSRNWQGTSAIDREQLLELPTGVHLVSVDWSHTRPVTVWLRDGTLRSLGDISGGGVPQLLRVKVRSTSRSGIYFRLRSDATPEEADAAPVLGFLATTIPAGRAL